MAIVDEARKYRELGYAIVWLRSGDKRPKRKGWRKRSDEPEQYDPGDAIGIQTGTASGNLVCIDLDDAKAVELADQYLPDTEMIEGRASRRRSHRWYKVTDVPTSALSELPDGGILRRPEEARLCRVNRFLQGTSCIPNNCRNCLHPCEAEAGQGGQAVGLAASSIEGAGKPVASSSRAVAFMFR
jgi:hypothetical protein